jgi:uncharacterized repeat protein (TIGR03803 family)
MTKMRICELTTLARLVLAFAATEIQAQTYIDLYNFGTNSGDPIQAQPAVIAQGRDGNLYSATERGGTDSGGTAFEVTPTGDLSVIYNFGFPVGEDPSGGLTLGTNGNLYGTTQSGGTGPGIVFEVTPAGKLTTLHKFDTSDGASPYAPPIQGVDGNFYGTTFGGGTDNHGTVYKLSASGELTTLYMFDGSDGAGPIGPLVQGINRDFYGTTNGGGDNNNGTVFKITSKGEFTTLYFFDGTHGMQPTAPLVQGTNGSFYGTTTNGGAYGQGTVYKVNSKGKLTVLYSFSQSSGMGCYPAGGLVLGSDGNFYGTASQGGTNNDGTVYRSTPRGAYSMVHSFVGTDGSSPLTTLLQHTTGVLYGDTYSGGTYGLGVFFSLNVGLNPFVSFLPQQSPGKVGASIGIFGQGLTGTTGVSFGGTPATFTVSSDTYLTATVPGGAETGVITVTTPGGTLTSNKTFRVTH